MKATVQTEGFRELERTLAQLGSPNARRNSAVRAGMKALAPMGDVAKSLAPRQSGNMADSIIVGRKASGANAGRQAFGQILSSGGTRAEAVQAMRDAQRETASQVFVYMGPGRHPQAITQEFGTYFHPPQAFMRPAWDQESMATLDRLKVELWADIERAVARAEAAARRRAARQGA